MRKTILLLTLLVLAAGFVSADMMDGSGMGGMMYGMYGGYGAGMMIFSWLFGLLVIIALILLIVWLIKQIQKK